MSLDWLPRLLPKLQRLSAGYGVPLGVSIGWIAADTSGVLDDRGLYGIHHDESHDLYFNNLRFRHDEDYALDCGHKLMQYHRRLALGLNVPGLADGSDLQWSLSAFLHCMGLHHGSTVIREAARASSCVDWDTFAAYCRRNDTGFTARLASSTAHWATHVDKVRDVGRPYGLDVQACPPPTKG